MNGRKCAQNAIPVDGRQVEEDRFERFIFFIINCALPANKHRTDLNSKQFLVCRTPCSPQLVSLCCPANGTLHVLNKAW